MDPFEELTSWYQAQCNGDWEHSFGVHIVTQDRRVKIDLTDTNLAAKPFSEVAEGVGKDSHRSRDSSGLGNNSTISFATASRTGALSHYATRMYDTISKTMG